MVISLEKAVNSKHFGTPSKWEKCVAWHNRRVWTTFTKRVVKIGRFAEFSPEISIRWPNEIYPTFFLLLLLFFFSIFCSLQHQLPFPRKYCRWWKEQFVSFFRVFCMWFISTCSAPSSSWTIDDELNVCVQREAQMQIRKKVWVIAFFNLSWSLRITFLGQ